MKFLPTSALALSLLVAAAPLAAFAEDGGSSGSTTVEAHADGAIQAPVPGQNPKIQYGAAIRADLHNLLGGKPMRPMEASSSDSRPPKMEHASGTPPMNGGNGNGQQVRARGDGEIDARIANLNKMISRLDGAVRLSDDAKASLKTELTTQITNLTNLKARIDTEATTTLKEDTRSITKDFRIYALVLPKAAITAAADRIMTVVGQMQTLSGKIGARISAAQTAGANVSAAVTAHADFDAKVADASVQAQAAVSAVAGLSPDNGATTTLQANTAALKDAKAKIDAAQKDLRAARQDAETILRAIRGKGEVKTTATTTASS